MNMTTTNYLDRAVSALSAIGIHITGQSEPVPILALLEKLKPYDEKKVVSIAATLQQSSAFHRVVREQQQGLDVGTLYQSITDNFTSIRTDSEKMATWMADGKLDLIERAQMAFMKITRGSIPERFDEIRKHYEASVKSVGRENEREEIIRDAYQDYHAAMLQCMVQAEEILVIATASLEEKRLALTSANAALEAAQATGDGFQIAELELKGHEALRAFQAEDRAYQIAKDLAEDQKAGHTTTKVIMAHMQQVSGVKERLHSRMISFFTGQEGVLTALSAAFTARNGLASATNVLKAQKAGTEASIEALARTSDVQMRDAISMAYGPGIAANPVIELGAAILRLQTDMHGLIAEARDLATGTANAIESATVQNERSFAAMIAKEG